MTTVESKLREAIEAQARLVIIYNAGSRPGQARAIYPLGIQGGTLFARDVASNVRKSFKLNAVGSIVESTGEVVANALAIPPVVSSVPNLATIAEYAELLQAEFTGSGWHVTVEVDRFAVSGYFKNGKPRKTPSVQVCFIDRSEVPVFDLATEEIKIERRELTGRERPWRIDSWRLSAGKSMATLQKAMEIFVEEARASSPLEAGSIRS